MTTATMSGPHAPKAELRALTGLRAVAALGVVVSHVRLPLSAPDWMRDFAAWGYIGVPLFFVLSGFVLAYNYPTLSPDQPGRVVRFYIARIARVMPLYWAVIFYCVLVRYLRGNEQFPHTIVKNIFAVQTWSGNVTEAQGYYNGPGWSIGVELFFYALFPLLIPVIVMLARRYRTAGMVVVIVAVNVIALSLMWWFQTHGRDLPAADPLSAHRWLYRNPMPRLVDFIAGMAAAQIFGMLRERRVAVHHLIQAGVIGYVLLMMTLRENEVGSIGPIGFYGAYWVLPFAILCLSLATGAGWFARFLATAPLVRLGTASYALYITHRWLVGQLAGHGNVEHQYGMKGVVGFFLVIAVLLLVAEGAHQYVEVPCRRGILALMDRIRARRQKPDQEPAPTS